MQRKINASTEQLTSDIKLLMEHIKWQEEIGVDTAIAENSQMGWQNKTAATQFKFDHTLPKIDKNQNTQFTAQKTQQKNLGSDLLSSSSPTAQYLASNAENLDDLYNAIINFTGCEIKQTARSTVIFDGNSAADLMIIGEAPGREEDYEGKPFVGAAGQLLNKMLSAIGINRKDCYITNVMFWRPPGNRNPNPKEIEAVLPFTLRHIELIKPKVVLTMGNIATKALREDDTGIMRTRGSQKELSCGNYKVNSLATFHPAYLLRQQKAKRAAWEDMQLLQKLLA